MQFSDRTAVESRAFGALFRPTRKLAKTASSRRSQPGDFVVQVQLHLAIMGHRVGAICVNRAPYRRYFSTGKGVMRACSTCRRSRKARERQAWNSLLKRTLSGVEIARFAQMARNDLVLL